MHFPIQKGSVRKEPITRSYHTIGNEIALIIKKKGEAASFLNISVAIKTFPTK